MANWAAEEDGDFDDDTSMMSIEVDTDMEDVNSQYDSCYASGTSVHPTTPRFRVATWMVG